MQHRKANNNVHGSCRFVAGFPPNTAGKCSNLWADPLLEVIAGSWISVLLLWKLALQYARSLGLQAIFLSFRAVRSSAYEKLNTIGLRIHELDVCK
jgi:hypothetical protein